MQPTTHATATPHTDIAAAAFSSELQAGFLEGRLCQKKTLACVQILVSKIPKIKKMGLTDDELSLALRAVLRQARNEAAKRRDELHLASEELPNRAREISHRASRLLEAGRFKI